MSHQNITSSSRELPPLPVVRRIRVAGLPRAPPAANALDGGLFGAAMPATILHMLRQVFTTSAGWTLIIVGNAIGFLFAVVALTLSVVSFPLLLDRKVGAAAAVLTSIRAVAANPV